MSSYAALPEEEEKFLSSSSSENGSMLDYRRTEYQKSFLSTLVSFPGVLHWVAHGLTILLLSFIFFHYPRASTDPQVLYNAAYGEKPVPLHFEVFKAAFWENTTFKAYPGPPSEKTLAAWDHITDTPLMNLTEDEVYRMELSKDSVRWPKSAGGGYIATLEITHQLHCLRTIWMRHQYNKNPELPMFAEMKAMMEELPDIADAHLEHCVDIIRQRLMCTADPAVVTFRWVKGVSTPYPNFHNGHMCANHESLLRWAESRKADMDKVEGWDYHVNFADGDVEIDHLP